MLDRPTLGVIMDPISHIHPEKDTTLALLLAAQERGFELHYMEISDLFLQYGKAFGQTRGLIVQEDLQDWYQLSESIRKPLDYFDVLLMRQDPPVTMEYFYATYILEHAAQNGVLVVNDPQSLRDANEKLFTTWFPQCIPPTIVSSAKTVLNEFIKEQDEIILKPLDAMGGRSVFKCKGEDPNINVIIDLLTKNGTQHIMAQRYIPEITEGDKRILLIDGEPIPYALARIPAEDDFRGNLVAGAIGEGRELTERDAWICAQIGPTLREKGLLFVGIDVIGDFLTEINVTSPTCVRELDKAFDLDIAGQVLDCIMDQLQL